MKFKLLLAVLLAGNTMLSAQTITTNPQPVYKSKESLENLVNYGSGFISYQITQNKKFITLASRFRSLYYNIVLVKYDSTMKTVNVNNLDDGVTKYGPYPAQVKTLNNKFYLIYYEYRTEKDEVAVNLAEINPESLALSAPLELMTFKQADVGVFRAQTEYDANQLSVVSSPDKSKWLFMRQTSAHHECSFAVTDQNMKLIFNKTKNVEDALFKNASVDNKGTVYTAYKIMGKKVQGHILVSQANFEKDISLGDDEPCQIALVPSVKSNMIHVVGNCYGETQYVSGVFSASLSTDKFVLTNYKRTDFPEAFVDLSSQHKLGFSKERKYGFAPFWMAAYEMEDGTIDMTGGLYRYKANESMDMKGRSTVDPEYIAGSILNIRFDKQGTPVFSRIARDRVAESPLGQNFMLLRYHNNMVVLYNDNPENLNLADDASPKSSDKVRNSVLMSAIVTPDGKVTKKIVTDMSEDHFVSSPDLSFMTSDKSFKMPFRKVTKSDQGDDEYRWVTMVME